MKKETLVVNNLEQTKQLANKFLDIVRPNVYLLLSGDLGAGKTTFTRQLLNDVGVNQPVTSPTFVILNQYKSKQGLTINHMDAYRLTNNEELDMYLEEFENSFNIIEWWQNIDLDINKINYVKINIKRIDDNSREFSIERNF